MINKVVQILQENTPVPNSHVTQMEVGSCVEKIKEIQSCQQS